MKTEGWDWSLYLFIELVVQCSWKFRNISTLIHLLLIWADSILLQGENQSCMGKMPLVELLYGKDKLNTQPDLARRYRLRYGVSGIPWVYQSESHSPQSLPTWPHHTFPNILLYRQTNCRSLHLKTQNTRKTLDGSKLLSWVKVKT